MPVRILRFEKNDTLALPRPDTGRGLWKVERRVREGYVLSSKAGDPDRLWTHDEIFDAYSADRLEHWPCNLQGLDEALAEMLQTELEGWSPRKIFEARCREEYVLRVEVLRARGVAAKTAYRRAAKVVFRARRAKWAREAERIDAVEQAERNSTRRKARPTALSTAAPVQTFELGEFSVRNWFLDWKKGGEDIRALIAKTHRRGHHGRRYECRLDDQVDERQPLCVYGAMAWVARSVYMQVPRVTKRYAFKRLTELCQAEGFPTVSDTTFYTFLRTHYTEFEEFRARYGPRAAYLKYHIFERRALPDRALEEVEVDHTLLDVFVTDDQGRKARPWLTVLICRATKMILGIHISFEVPSYASLSRAIIHAMSPKDLSGMPEVKNDWPCHGVFSMLITDRGLEFLSESLQRAGRDLRFAVVNLPGRMPHLKGTVERFFGTLGIRVLTHMEGCTLSRTDQYYDPKAEARFTLSELTAKIVKWIVDDYHQTKHDTLNAAPITRWRELAEDPVMGGVRAVGRFSRLVMLMGERFRRTISNVGIHFDGHIYASNELALMRRRRGGLTGKVELLADVTDRGHIWVLDAHEKRWIIVPAVNQRAAKGLNKIAARLVMRVARKLVGRGEEVTDDVLEKAREICDREARTANTRAALRYCSRGALATNVLGNASILPILCGAWMPSKEEDDETGQGVLFPDLPGSEAIRSERDQGMSPAQGSADGDGAPIPSGAAKTSAPAPSEAAPTTTTLVETERVMVDAEADKAKPRTGASLAALLASRSSQVRTLI
jgi:putative transposase